MRDIVLVSLSRSAVCSAAKNEGLAPCGFSFGEILGVRWGSDLHLAASRRPGPTRGNPLGISEFVVCIQPIAESTEDLTPFCAWL